jgi:hypothetical protein
MARSAMALASVMGDASYVKNALGRAGIDGVIRREARP